MGFSVGELVNNAANFAGGFANAWGSDNLLGAGRQEQQTTAGKLGAAFGDATATVQGLLEIGEGVGGEVGGVVLDATGVGALVGVPVNIVSAGLIVHGATTSVAGLSHLAMTAAANTPDGGSGTPDSTPSPASARIPGSSDEEYAVDQYLTSKGDKVEKNPLEGKPGAGRQPDRLVNGVPTEYKTLSGVENPTADSLSAAEASRIMDARGQSSHIIVDVRGQQGVTREIAERGVARAYGADNVTGAKIQSIRIIGNDFDITVPRS
jgi:hypothetical protein